MEKYDIKEEKDAKDYLKELLEKMMGIEE